MRDQPTAGTQDAGVVKKKVDSIPITAAGVNCSRTRVAVVNGPMLVSNPLAYAEPSAGIWTASCRQWTVVPVADRGAERKRGA